MAEKPHLTLVDDELGHYENLPAEMLVDPYHPHNSDYYKSLHRIDQAITHVRAKMKPKHAQIVILHHQGHDGTDIAKRVKVSAATVYNALKSKNGKELAALLIHRTGKLDAPSETLRQHFLWQIANEQRQERPNVAVSAVDTLNKMTGVYAKEESKNEINITINGDVFTKGALDRPAQTFESRRQDIEDVET